MNKKTIIPIIFAIMLLSVSFVHAADNQFQDITDLIGDVFEMISDIFMLDVFHSPDTAFGLLLFLFWIAIFSLLYFGVGTAFTGMTKKLKIIIGAVPATMMVILMNFETEFFVAILGSWLVPTILILLYLMMGVVIFLLFKLPETPMVHIIRGLVLIVFATFVLNLDVSLIIKAIEDAARNSIFISPYIFKKIMDKKEKWQ